MSFLFNRVLIIGVGLIGGSLALGFQKQGIAREVLGVDINAQSLKLAVELGVINSGFTDLEEVLKNPVDLILLATPVQRSIDWIHRLSQSNLSPGCIVTDVSSTKNTIQKVAEQELPGTVHFIGGHPMAGSHKSGVDAANALLVENAVYVLTRAAHRTHDPAYTEACERLQAAIERLNAHILWLDSKVHDQVVAAISHVPHVIAAQLVDLVADLSSDNPYYVQLASSGFRDTTRIASGSPEMWSDIVRTNSDSIKQLMGVWQKRTQQFIDWVDSENYSAIYTFFERARNFRDHLPQNAKGAARHYFDLTVQVPDHPGVLGQVTTLLGNASIGIRNIGILENREGENGQLLLSFDTETDRSKGQQLLESQGFHVSSTD